MGIGLVTAAAGIFFLIKFKKMKAANPEGAAEKKILNSTTDAN